LQDDAPPIEELSCESLEATAQRLVSARSFEQFVYRECEMDALFSLADIAIASLGAKDASADTLAQVRALIFEAHDLSHDEEMAEAAVLLRRAATLLAESGVRIPRFGGEEQHADEHREASQ
jgi:hypothetical protein